MICENASNTGCIKHWKLSNLEYCPQNEYLFYDIPTGSCARPPKVWPSVGLVELTAFRMLRAATSRFYAATSAALKANIQRTCGKPCDSLKLIIVYEMFVINRGRDRPHTASLVTFGLRIVKMCLEDVGQEKVKCRFI